MNLLSMIYLREYYYDVSIIIFVSHNFDINCGLSLMLIKSQYFNFRKCALLQTSRQCHYRMRLGDQENQWYCISQICRNRVSNLIDFNLRGLFYIEIS